MLTKFEVELSPRFACESAVIFYFWDQVKLANVLSEPPAVVGG